MTNKDFLYPLRRLHGWLVEKRIEHTKKTTLLDDLHNNHGKIAVIPGTPEHPNLGDSAIVLAQVAFLKKCGFSNKDIKETSFSQHLKYHKVISRRVSRNALITHLGGGNMGSQWKSEEEFHRIIVKDYPSNPMIIFPQTIYYSPEADDYAHQSKDIYSHHSSLTLVAREHTSLKIMQGLYPGTPLLLTPDIVLSCTMDDFGVQPRERNGILLCMRSDAERAMTDAQRQAVENIVSTLDMPFKYTDMYSDCRVTKENRRECVRKKMDEFAGSRLVITDRLHGMIFAAITGTPCIAFGNYNHKVKGTYEWISYLPYIRYVESVEEAEKVLPVLLAMEDCHYDNTPLLPHFEKLAQVVKNHAHN